MNVSRRGSVLLESSSVRRRHTLSPTVNEARTTPRLVHMTTGAELKGADIGDCGMSAISSAQEQRPTSPVVTMAAIAQPSSHATAQGNSNLKSSKMGEISGGLIEFDSPVQEGRHAPRMGPNQQSTQPVMGYRPTPGLVRLFAKTGTAQHNPKLFHRTDPPPLRRTYADVLRIGMEGSGAPAQGKGADVGYCGNGTRGFRGSGQADAVARGGYQRPYQRQVGGGFHGGRGGGRQYETRGRGFGGLNRHYQSNYNGQRAPQATPWQNLIPSRDTGDLPDHRRGVVHGQWGDVQGQQHLYHQAPLGQGS
jgi:hypothetical protein